jgi:outer membrane protein, multidrug efflux system
MTGRLNAWRAALGATHVVVAIGGISVLAGCATSPPATTRPQVTLPAQFSALAQALQSAAAGDSRIGSDWWTLYGDPGLTELVNATLRNNTDLRLAVARVDETAAVLGLARAAQWPTVELGGSVTRSRISTLNGQPVPSSGAESTSHRIAASTSFELDLWGRLRQASAAAQQQMLAAVYARDTVRIALAAATVQAYFGLRSLDAQLAVNAAQLRSRSDSLRLVERRVAGGVASTLDAALARTALSAVRAQAPDLQRQRGLLQHQLAQLTGQPELAISPSTAALTLPATPPPGLPAQLLERRPDIAQAEAQLSAARFQVEVARRAIWPTISLTGTYGSQSASLADLLKSGAQFWALGPAALLTLFDAGRTQARTDQARAQAEQAAIGYQRAALTAFRETADALVTAEQNALQEAEVEVQRTEANEALRIANRRYEAGYSGFLDVLEAQRSVQDAELALVRVRQARLDASVALIKALGGGWSAPADAVK